MVGHDSTGRDGQVPAIRQQAVIAIPPAYPNPEAWRRFGLLRQQLQRSERLRREPPPAADQRR